MCVRKNPNRGKKATGKQENKHIKINTTGKPKTRTGKTKKKRKHGYEKQENTSKKKRRKVVDGKTRKRRK